MDITYPDDLFKEDYYERQDKQSCPYIRQHIGGCYCTDLNSQTIESALQYCAGNFRLCRQYAGLAGSGSPIKCE